MALRELWQRTTLLDRTIVLLLLTGALAGAFWAGAGPRGTRVVVEGEGGVLFTAPLGYDRTVALSGPLGETVLELKGGEARILSSPCPNKVCIGMGAVARAGEIVACVPNRLLMRVEGESQERGHDLLTR